jgi:hypothetical protein
VLFLQDKKKERKGRQEEADRSRKGGIYTCVTWIHQRTILIAIFVTLTCMAQTKGEAKRAAVGKRHAPTRGGEPLLRVPSTNRSFLLWLGMIAGAMLSQVLNHVELTPTNTLYLITLEILNHVEHGQKTKSAQQGHARL